MNRFFWLFAMSLFALTLFSFNQSAAQEKALEEMFEAEQDEEDYYRADRVLLSATKRLMDARKAPAINTVITEKEIRNMGARDLQDILRRVPGLGLARAQASSGGILEVRGIRTVTTEKVLLMIDSHRLNNHHDGSWMSFFFNDLPVEDIKRIEIVRGPGSALFGANAFVGVINVITKTAEDINGTQFTAGRGNYSTEHYNGIFGYQNKDNKMRISGHADYYDTNGVGYLIEQDALGRSGETVDYCEKVDAGIKMAYEDISFRFRVVNKENGPYIGVLRTLNDESVEKFTQVLGDLIYTKNITEDLGLKAKLYGDYYKYDIFWEAYPNGFTGGDDKGLLGNPKFKNNILGGEITTDYTVGDHYFTAGIAVEHVEQYDVRHIDNFFDLTSDPIDRTDVNNFNKDVTREIYAAYLQYMWEITAYDSLTVGVRYDHYSDFGNTINPRAGYVHEFKNGLLVKALYGSAFRAPTFQELYTINNPSTLGNEGLDAEKIQTGEIGVELPFLKHFTFGISCFYNEITDLIKRGPAPSGGGPAMYENTGGETTAQGFEAQLDMYFSKNHYAYVNCSYQDTEDENGETLPEVAHWKANAGYNIGITKYLNANVNTLWVGERPRAETDTRDDLDSNILFDLSLIGKEFYNSLEIRGSVYNVFDEDYRDPSEDLRVPNDYPANARTFLAEIRYKF